MTSANTIATLLSLSILAGAGYYLFSKINPASKGSDRTGYTGKYDPKTGLGRGAPGFQTNVSRIAVPAHIIARIRSGEEVSAEEITAAQEEEARRRDKEERSGKTKGRKAKGEAQAQMQSSIQRDGGKADTSDNQWLPDHLTRSSQTGRVQGGRKR